MTSPKRVVLSVLFCFLTASVFAQVPGKSLDSLRVQVMRRPELADASLLRRIMSYREKDQNILLAASANGDMELIRQLAVVLPDSGVFLSTTASRENAFHLAKDYDTALALLKTYSVLRLREKPGEKDVFDRRAFKVALINASTFAGETPVMTQIKRGNYAVAVLYLAKNADLTLQTNEGDTPLHLAVKQAQGGARDAVDLVESFLRGNPYTVFLKDAQGRTALDLAKELKARFAYEKIKEIQDQERESSIRNVQIRLANWFKR